MATSIRLSTKAEQRLDFLAAQTGRTKAFLLAANDRERPGRSGRLLLAADVLERVRKGEEKIHSSAEVRSDLGLGD